MSSRAQAYQVEGDQNVPQLLLRHQRPQPLSVETRSQKKTLLVELDAKKKKKKHPLEHDDCFMKRTLTN